MNPVALRVAARYQRAGLFQAPPAMFRDIYAWVQAVVAATAIAKANGSSSSDFSDPSERYQPLLNALKELEQNPTNWKAYVAAYDASWIFGHPGTRWSVKDFQKLTPEKKTELTARVQKWVALRREQSENSIEYEKKLRRKREEDNAAEIARLTPYLLPGVSGLEGDKVSKKFPIDLTGWKYGKDNLLKEMLEKFKADNARLHDVVKEKVKEKDDDWAKEYVEKLFRRMTHGEGFWDSITVQLQTDAGKYAGFWQQFDKMLVLVVPYGASPWEMERLAGVLRHELQHFGQSFLLYALKGEHVFPEPGDNRPGFPSPHIQTPEYRQELSPSHPSFRQDRPELVELQKRLREQGLDIRQVNLHDLDDIEFYTELSDSIDDFVAKWSQNSDGSKAIAIKLFTGTLRPPKPPRSLAEDESWKIQMDQLGGLKFVRHFEPHKFFLALRRHAPGKYQKALKEFVKAVS